MRCFKRRPHKVATIYVSCLHLFEISLSFCNIGGRQFLQIKQRAKANMEQVFNKLHKYALQ